MDVKVEQMSEKNMYRLTIEATAEEFERGVQKAYEKNKGKISIPGFRKGKAPRKIIEKMYGKNFFHDEAVNEIVPELYEQAKADSDLEIVSKPSLKVVKMDEEKPLVFTAEVAVKPEIKLGKYKGVEVEKQDTEVTDSEIEEELTKAQTSSARIVEVTDRPAQDKDVTTIDFEGTIDGVPFEGGKGTDYPLTIGSHTFIDTFEDQMIGMNVGEVRDIKVKFPDEYHASALKGKDAVFKVTLKEIKEKQLPELNDEFAEDNGYDSLADYKENIKKNLAEAKETSAKNKKEREALDEVIEGCEIDLPAALVDTQVQRMAGDIERNVTQQGMKFDQYLQYMNTTAEKFMENLRPDAEKRLMQRLVLEAVAKAEGIEVSDEEYNAEIEKNAKKYNLEAKEFEVMLDDEGKKLLREDVEIRKALELITGQAKEVAKKAEKTAKTTKSAKADKEGSEEKAEKKTTAKKVTAKKTTAKKSEEKAEDKAEEKKPAAKKTAAKKTTAKKAEDKAEEKEEEKKPAAKKPAAKKTAASKTSATKKTAEKEEKPAAKKTAAKKSAAKKED